jgi:hypothetical protein
MKMIEPTSKVLESRVRGAHEAPPASNLDLIG